MLVLLLKRLDLSGVEQRIAELGWWLLGLACVTGFAHFLRACAWAGAFDRSRRPGLFRLWVTRLAGESFSYLTSAGALLGDPMKVALSRHTTSVLLGASTVVLDRGLNLFATTFYLLTGLLALLILTRPDRSMAGSLTLLAVSLVLLAGGMVWVVRSRSRIISGVSGAIERRLAWKKLEGSQESSRQLEDYIFALYQRQPRRFRLMIALNLAASLVTVTQVYWVLNRMGIQADWIQCLALAGSGKIIDFAFFFVPLRIGVFESGQVILLRMLGFSSGAGILLAFTRRIFDITWVILGFLGFIVLELGQLSKGDR